jgi:hypothetical protein
MAFTTTTAVLVGFRKMLSSREWPAAKGEGTYLKENPLYGNGALHWRDWTFSGCP